MPTSILCDFDNVCTRHERRILILAILASSIWSVLMGGEKECYREYLYSCPPGRLLATGLPILFCFIYLPSLLFWFYKFSEDMGNGQFGTLSVSFFSMPDIIHTKLSVSISIPLHYKLPSCWQQKKLTKKVLSELKGFYSKRPDPLPSKQSLDKNTPLIQICHTDY